MKISKKRLMDILTKGLKLRDPEFRLDRGGELWYGSVISPTFRGKGDFARQQKIWDTLERELGPAPARFVGGILAYTPEEWNWNSNTTENSRPRRKAS